MTTRLTSLTSASHRIIILFCLASRLTRGLFVAGFSRHSVDLRLWANTNVLQMPRASQRRLAAASSKATPESVASSDNADNDNDELLLKDWMTHDDLEFHKLNEATATQIRSALLEWYRQNRRKLPWRGDAPPYDGSTAGINTNNNNHKQQTKPQSNKITNFFQPTAKKARTAKLSPDPAPSSSSSSSEILSTTAAAAIPVSAYGVWVSEIMLQQTRVEAVIPYWIKWMTTFPTVYALAEASEEQVNAHWAGLGFYRRARLLHQGAQLVVQEYDGELPRTVPELLKITGIGPYTASAIASIAYGTCVPVVDGNVCRVLSRLRGIANHIKAPALKDKYGWDLATQIVQAGDGSCAGEVNQALMELGATYCAPSGTGIDPRDPLKDYYYSTGIGKAYVEWKRAGKALPKILENCTCSVCDSNGIQAVVEALEERILLQDDVDKISEDDSRKLGHAVFPLDPPKSKRREEDLAVAVIANQHQNETWWLLIRRPAKGLLAGQWEFPSLCVESRQEGQSKPPTPPAAKRRKALTSFLDGIIVGEQQQSWWSPTTTNARRAVDPAPLEHIFSHVKHNMYLEARTMEVDLQILEWKTEDDRQVRWMRESDMDQVGITSGVKKILKAVKAIEPEKAKKRKR